MMKKLVFLFLCLTLTVSACGSNLPPHIAAQFAAPTPTPFLPGPFERVANTANSETISLDDGPANIQVDFEIQVEKEAKDVWGDFLAPTLLSDLVIPSPVPSFDLDQEYARIVILGSDQRPEDPSYRTDVILLLLIDKRTESATMISFPRDLYVYQPGYKMDRINSAHLRGGAELIYDTFEYNFGIRPEHFILVNFNGFSSIVDSLGGIDVDVPYALTDHRDGFGDYTVLPGNVAMDAETALWYVRSRGTSSDFDRGRRQQEVLTGLFFSAFSFDMLSNATDIYQAYKDSVQTDISLVDFLHLAPLAGQVFSNHSVEHVTITANEVEPWRNSSKAAVLLPDREKLLELFSTALN